MVYPPVDSSFYNIGSASGMSDDEIQKDWEAYCDDLKKFHDEIDAQQIPPTPSSKPLGQPDMLIDQLKNLIKDSENG